MYIKTLYSLVRICVLICGIIISELLVGIPKTSAKDLSLADDAIILAYFDEMNVTDIWLARIAAYQGSIKDVRDIGLMILQDHEIIMIRSRKLAKRLGIIPHPEPTDQSAAKLAELVALVQSKTGAEFDRVYLTHELGFSEVFLALIKQLVSVAKHKELKRFLGSVVQEFEHHVAHMRTAVDKLDIPDHHSNSTVPSHHH
jgi:predicted outer membrane protein